MSMSFILHKLQLLVIFNLLFLHYNNLQASRITHLPGFSGTLPFYLETGYVTVDEESGAELFYYFVESERSPSDDPLVLWLIGGPYCSGFAGLALEIGPLKFKVKTYDDTLPTLIANPYSWTKIASIIFLDWPVGTGFSFSTSMTDYITDEVLSAKQIYEFLIKWLLGHPSFQSNHFYVGGDSYGGKMTPLLAQLIVKGNEDVQQPFVNLKGYLVGNPVTGERIDISSQAPYAHGLGIISDELLKEILLNCEDEDYLNPKSALCRASLKTFNGFLSEINIYNILEPKCADEDEPLSPKELYEASMSIKGKSLEFHCSSSVLYIDCSSAVLLSYYWSNDDLTKEALNIKKGTVEEWHRCREDLNNYTYNIPSSIPYHLNLTSRGYRALVHSGDHDLEVPFISTLEWIRSLNYSIIDDWRSWYAGGQVAGYTMLFSNNLTFATVKGIAVVALLRHFRCICCWKLASELKELIPRFDAAGVKLIAIGVGSPDNARILAQRLPFPLDYLYADPDRKAYDVLGLYHGLGRTFFNPASRTKVFARFSSLRKAAANYTISATPDDKSSVLQQGGMLVFKGKELLYARKNEGTGDHAPLEEVLNICCKVPVALQ